MVRRSQKDVWVWKLVMTSVFLVRSSYDNLLTLAGTRIYRLDNVLWGLDRIWKSKTTYKVVMVSWLILHNRFPTRHNLLKRQITC